MSTLPPPPPGANQPGVPAAPPVPPAGFGGQQFGGQPQFAPQPTNAQPGYGSSPQGRFPRNSGQPSGRAGAFFKSLFDLKFDTWVTTQAVPVLYVISLAFITLGAVIAFFALIISAIGAFSVASYVGSRGGAGVGGGIVLILIALIGVPIAWFFQIVLTRIGYEFFISIIKIAENTGITAKRERH